MNLNRLLCFLAFAFASLASAAGPLPPPQMPGFAPLEPSVR